MRTDTKTGPITDYNNIYGNSSLNHPREVVSNPQQQISFPAGKIDHPFSLEEKNRVSALTQGIQGVASDDSQLNSSETAARTHVLMERILGKSSAILIGELANQKNSQIKHNSIIRTVSQNTKQATQIEEKNS